MKRLYIGGLGHTVSEKDLKDRFGKFGDVSDVEIITRKDEHGSPLKTFGYININITDAEYKRCIGILNKSTWKGGTLLIQMAKESFLHRLAEERQQLAEKTITPKIDPQEKLVDSLKAAGVENFHMKAAVPGTEIPGHKDWVVSKFGRVLPVLNLKCKGKNKVFKYDPSKHCHNIKRLETADNIMSVSKLTWEMEGGDDEISKKRRGEFPQHKPCPKRSKVDLSSFLSNLAQSNSINAADIGNKNKMVFQQNGLPATKTEKQIPVVKKSVCVLDNDADSEDEIRMLVAQELSTNTKQTSAEDEDDNLEVVGDDFVVKSNAFWGGAEQDGVKSLLTSSKEDEDYDSADTDEILTQRKTQKTQVSQDSPTKSSKNESSSESDSGSNDSDYEAMMGNCTRLDLSLADLEQLAKNAEVISDDESVEEPKIELKTPRAACKRRGNNPEDILASLLGDDTPDKERKNRVTTVSLPAFIGTRDLFEGPEPILKRVTQSIDSESPKRLKQDLNVKERSISEDTSQPQSSNRPSQQKLSSLKEQSTSKKLENQSSENDSSSDESESSEAGESAQVVTFKKSSATQPVRTNPKTELKTVSSNNANTSIKPKQTKISRSSSSDSESSEEEDNEDSVDVSAFKPSSATQSIRTDAKTELKTVSSNSNNPIKPKQTKVSRSSSSDSESSEEEDSEDSAEVSTSKTSSATQSIRTNTETKLKTVSSNIANTPIKPKQTKISRSSSSDSESSEEEDNEDSVDVSAFKPSSATQSIRTDAKTELKTVSSNSNNPIKKNKQTKVSRSSSSDSESSEEEDSEDSAEVSTSKTSSATQSIRTNTETKLKTVSSNIANTPIKPKQTKVSRSSSSDSESSEEEDSEDSAEVSTSKTSSATQLTRTNTETKLKTVSSNNANTPIKPKQTKISRSSSSDSSSEESETSDDEKSRPQPKDSKPADSKKVQEKVDSHPTVFHSTAIDAQKQQKDNQKRLAALEQRQKETEQQKKLIQGALSSVDMVKANKGKHIVFDSDEEEEDKTTNKPEEQPRSKKKSLFEDDSESDDQQPSTSKEKENKKSDGNKLFDSEDEDDGAEDDRFQIKPQFEGKAGQKLMQLQARFGTDSRFQIDSRFLESDDETEDQDAAAPEKDEEQLLEEKKKSLDILQSILKTSIQPQNTKKSKMFKDVSGLHYDPTQEEHAAFESKTEMPKKESKAARRKKREEAEKLPEVSKDIYFEVSADLKEVFGTSKENQDEEEPKVSWDKEAEETEDIMTPMEVSFTSNVEAHEDTSGGFKFSFFGEVASAETTTKTDDYKIETLKGAKFSWQMDPRFQDSSSDEEGVDEVEEDQSASSKITEEPTPSKKSFFFFFQDDKRLKEGPRMFCRSGKLGDQREAWEEKRTSLRDECRKKHKDAKRRQRPSLKKT
ncbi:nucleolar protein 8 isoform X5 [Ctenopharyngodon idella]|uniref:nucleolar protein 8 isoform X5 n=1 Tax=Ctenopharyngodon idella TaxID=7959 RepID=UPI0022317E1A|nr:nucleolar protein 8 isoform X5 [Ctenopharyngodon idella]